MRIALGTIDVPDEWRRAIADYYGDDGLADRDTCRRFIVSNGTEGAHFAMAGSDGSGEEDWNLDHLARAIIAITGDQP